MSDEFDRYQSEPIDLEALARDRERREARSRKVIGVIGGIALGVLLVDLALEYAGGAFLLFRSRDDVWDSISVPHGDGAGVESTIDFTARVDRADAERLGAYLQRTGVFAGPEPKGCALSRRADGYVVSVFVPGGYLDDRDAIRELNDLRRHVSAEVFGNGPVVLQMCKRDILIDESRRHLSVVRELRD